VEDLDIRIIYPLKSELKINWINSFK